jgi:hypothetical protein
MTVSKFFGVVVNELMGGHQDLIQLFLSVKNTFFTIVALYANGHQGIIFC